MICKICYNTWPNISETVMSLLSTSLTLMLKPWGIIPISWRGEWMNSIATRNKWLSWNYQNTIQNRNLRIKSITNNFSIFIWTSIQKKFPWSNLKMISMNSMNKIFSLFKRFLKVWPTISMIPRNWLNNMINTWQMKHLLMLSKT